MRQYYKLNGFRILNAAVSAHWSALLVIAAIIVFGYKEPLHALIAVTSYFSILIIHEFGHAFVAARLGYRVYEIKIGFIHGVCCYESPYNELDHIKIAWGGVLAQLIVAIPVLVLAQFKAIADITYLGPIIAFLGYVSLIIALFNLAPAQGLDGHMAWKIVPLLFNRIKSRAKLTRSKQKKKNKGETIVKFQQRP